MQRKKLITALMVVFLSVAISLPAFADEGPNFDASIDKLKEYTLKATDFIKNIFSRDTEVPGSSNTYQPAVPQQLLQQAESGDAGAQCKLGYIYSLNEQDKDKSIIWWKKAATQGSSNGDYYLGLASYRGIGTRKDSRQAIKYWEKAANYGNVPSLVTLGEIYIKGKGGPSNTSKGTVLIQKAINSNLQDALSYFSIARVYLKGLGVPRDSSKGMSYMRKAAELGHPRAQTVLAYAYFSGQGVVRNAPIAMDWAQKASNQGDGWARILIGVAHYKGEGISSNKREAAEIINSTISANPGDSLTKG